MKQITTSPHGTAYARVLITVFIAALLLATGIGKAYAGPSRIVVVPYYTEEGDDVRDGGQKVIHYRRVMRYINNQLVRHDFEVINPFANEYKEEEYNRIMERSRQDSVLAARTLCKRYSTDAVYLVWLKIKFKKESNADGTLWRGTAILEGEGYDSAGRDLGAGLAKNWTLTKKEKDLVLIEVEKEIGYEVGRVLTAWSGRTGKASTPVNDVQPAAAVVPAAAGNTAARTSQPGGVLERNIKANEKLVNLRLDGATQYEIAEVFGKVVNSVTGVVEAKRYGSNITPGNPQASYVNWRVEIDNTDPFRLEANILKMIQDVLENQGEVELKGVPYRYSAAEVDLLRAIRPGQTTSMEVQFVVDREQARDADFSGRRDPYKAVAKPGFE
jgi:hypothetical protein